MSNFHLAYVRDGTPVSCDCGVGGDHDAEDRLVVMDSLTDTWRRFAEALAPMGDAWLGFAEQASALPRLTPRLTHRPWEVQLTTLPPNPFGDVIEGVGHVRDVQEWGRVRRARDGERGERGERENVNTQDYENLVLDEVRAARAERRKAEAKERIEAALTWLGEDTYDDHAVLRFTKRVNGRDWTYAAIKAEGRWYLTGRIGERHAVGMTWDDLTIWMVAGEPVVDLTLMIPEPRDEGVPEPRAVSDPELDGDPGNDGFDEEPTYEKKYPEDYAGFRGGADDTQR